jgi:hypothetical protein
MRRALSLAASLCLAGVACNTGTTGDVLISFTPYAAGAPNAGQPFVVSGGPGTGQTYSVQLTSASMYIGAAYFDESPTSTSFDAPVCNTADVFAAQVPGGVQVNLLSTEPQEFAVYGSGSADVALSWDLWLTNGDINEPNDTPTATITGTATLVSDPTKVYSFGAIVSINPGESGAGARGTPASDPALPGAYPICKERILQLGGLDLKFYQGGTLYVTVDPRGWFAATGGIDFPNLEPWNNSECQLDVDSNDTYESRGPCDASMACPDGLTCSMNTLSGNPECVEPCGVRGECSPGFVCNTQDNNCITEFCIPDTNWAACPSSDVDCGVTPAAAAAGEALFLGILGGGSSAYSVAYTGQGADE